MPDAQSRHITVLSASETGNARGVAEDLFAAIQEFHDNARLVDAGDYDNADLPSEDILLMVTSTQGDGEPPWEAEELYNHVMADTPDLSGVAFACLGLGDSDYGDDYNIMVKRFDARYGELGGRRLYEHGECDYDYDEAAEQWISEIIPVLKEEIGS